MGSTPTRKLYALIVGINNYVYVGKLGGCVNDAKNVLDYLETATQGGEFELKPLLLTDEKATKQNITDGFLKHLCLAEKDDVALFYFSGHGAQEKADDAWLKHEHDGKLETRVCVDSRSPEGIPDLADKEVRYLLAKVAAKNPHIITISDSCHSGSNTRPSNQKKRRLPDPEELFGATEEEKSRLTSVGPKRNWEQFLFHEEITPEMVQNADSLSKIIPLGGHVAMSACRDKELAYEIGGSGIFTSLFLDVLKRSSGKISYLNLHTRLRNTIKGRYKQSPELEANGLPATALKKSFLGGASNTKPTYYTVTRNKSAKIGWNINIGAIHGMPAIEPNNPITINILDPDDASKVIATARPREVTPGYTKLTILSLGLDPKQSYFAIVEGLFLNPVNFYITGDAKGVEALKERLKAKEDEIKQSNINIVDGLGLADYLIQASDSLTEFYFIGEPIAEKRLDTKYEVIHKGHIDATEYDRWRWRVRRVKGFNEQGTDDVIQQMQHIAQWEFVKRLDNPRTTITPNPPVDFTVCQAVVRDDEIISEMPLAFNRDNELRISHDSFYGDDNPRFGFSVFIENNATRAYHCAVVALTNEFGIIPDMIVGGVIELKPGKKIRINDNWPFDFLQQEYIQSFNWEYTPIIFKLIMSTASFSVNEFAQDGEEHPKPDKASDRSGFGSRNRNGRRGHSSQRTKDDFAVSTFELQLINPMYAKPPEL